MSTNHEQSRRRFLRDAGLGVLATPVLFTACQSGGAAPQIRAGSVNDLLRTTKARRVIFLVSDGMSMGVPTLADSFSRQLRTLPTRMVGMMGDRNVSRGFFETHSLNSLVTDSAAAASSWGSGSRVFNGSINVLPDGTKMTPIHHLLKAEGYGTGLVTTATITHATPAGFAAAEASRGGEGSIATQYVGHVDVLLGGGDKFFNPQDRDDKLDVYTSYKAGGYTVLNTREQLLGLSPTNASPVLGLFAKGHLPYTLDQLNSADLRLKVPTLAEMTRSALNILAKNPKGFLLQVEGARIDHAAHGNDAAGLLWDQLAFDDAVAVAQEFALEYPDTLVIVTSDHGNASPSLNGMGSQYKDSTECFGKVGLAKASFEVISNQISDLKTNGKVSSDSLGTLVSEMTGLTISPADAAVLEGIVARKENSEIHEQHRSLVGVLGQILGNQHGIGWCGTTHTEEATVLLSKGPGQDAFNGLTINTDAFRILCDQFGISHRNPVMTAADSKKYVTSAHTPKWHDYEHA